MNVRGAGPVVVSAVPKGCSSSSRLSSNAPQLVETLRRSIQLRRRFLNLFVVGPPPPPRPLDIKHVMNNTRPSAFFPHQCIIVNRNRRTEKCSTKCTQSCWISSGNCTPSRATQNDAPNPPLVSWIL